MDVNIILIAIGLAMDSFSVSIARGFNNTKNMLLIEALKTGFFFGLFQAVMPLLGWIAGLSIVDYISHVDHWIAFGLLSFIGLRMIYESISKKSKKVVNSTSFQVLLILSVATSIDALAIGLSFSFLETSIVLPVIMIGIITFVLSFFGVFIGKKFGSYFERIGVLGGIILLVIALRILFEHLELII